MYALIVVALQSMVEAPKTLCQDPPSIHPRESQPMISCGDMRYVIITLLANRLWGREREIHGKY